MENATTSIQPAYNISLNFSASSLVTAATIAAGSNASFVLTTSTEDSASLNNTTLIAATADVGNPNVLPQTSITDTIEILIYTICLCIGGPLNLISFRKLLRHFLGAKSASTPKQNAAHITLKLNLNIADLLTMFVYTLSQIVWMISYQWYAGDLLCRICKFFHTFGFYLNSFVVACFALDRAFSTYNLQVMSSSHASQARVKRMLTLAWIFAFLLSLPQSFIFRVVEPPEMKDFKQCTPIWTILGYEIDLEIGRLMKANLLTEARKNELMARFTKVVQWERTYNIAHLLFVFWIPTLIIVGSYMTMLCVLNSFSVPKSFKSRMSFRRTKRITKPSTCPKLLNRTTVLNNRNEASKDRDLLAVLNRPNSADSGIHDDRGDQENIPLKADAQQTLNRIGVTPQNSVTSVTATLNGTMESECSRMLAAQKINVNSLNQEGIAMSKHSKCKINTKKLNNNENKMTTSISSPPSIKFKEDIASIGGEKSCCRNSDSCPIQSFLPNGQESKVGNNNINNTIGNIILRRIAKARQKTKRQAALILMAYLTIWTPYNLLAMLNAFSSNDGMVKKVASVTLPFLNSMIVMNPIANPLIYGLYEGRRSSIS